jgi:hypothetical protein
MGLPPKGIDGLGRPTRAAPVGGLAATGTPVTDRSTVPFQPARLDTVLPVYPNGPPTITVPVRSLSPVAGTAPASRVIAVSYAACGPQVCLAPVTGYQLKLAR